MAIAVETCASSCKGLGSQTGFFCPVNCQKVKHNFQSYQFFILLYEYLCVSNKQKDRPKRNEGVYFGV